MSRFYQVLQPVTACLVIAWGGPGCDSGKIGTTDGGPGLEGSPSFLDAYVGKACVTSTECEGGVCHRGTCCPSEDQVCGESCCSSSQTCFAGACIVPGAECFTTADCEENQYCEPALGLHADAGLPPADAGRACLAPRPTAGRCLSLPPRCTGNQDPVGCLPACEYFPSKGGLNAEKKWQWGAANVQANPNYIDVWSTPMVARFYDTNCDGVVDDRDPPSVIFISGNARGNQCGADENLPHNCKDGVLRVLDGATGQELWSLRRPGDTSVGFAGLSIAVGDIDGDSTRDAQGRLNLDLEIVALSGEGLPVVIDHTGKVTHTATEPVPGAANQTFGWGGALALADMDHDGEVELAYQHAVYSIKADGTIPRRFLGAHGGTYLSTFVDLDGAADNNLELLAGRVAYQASGEVLWTRHNTPEVLPGGYSGVGDFDRDGKPEVVLVGKVNYQTDPAKGMANVWVLSGQTGATLAGPLELPADARRNCSGGPPTVANFAKDPGSGPDLPEIGVANDRFYAVVKPDLAQKTLRLLWSKDNHDLSSSVTGSTVFDFEGDGVAEVIYNDECFLWVYDGESGEVRFCSSTTSFTATEASIVADVNGDGHAEMLMISNGANPGPDGTPSWNCNVAPYNQQGWTEGGCAWTPPGSGEKAYRGLTLWGDRANSWVGTRTLWNQHTYHVTNICDSSDSACDPPNIYGHIPRQEKDNWPLPWLNNWRQNVQEEGIFDAPDAILNLLADCTDPIVLRAYLRNYGLALLPAGVKVGFFVVRDSGEILLGEVSTEAPLFPGQVAQLSWTDDGATALALTDAFIAKVMVDPQNPTFHECREDNNQAEPRHPACID